MKMKEIQGIKEIFRLQKIKELVIDRFIKGQIDKAISYIEWTINWEIHGNNVDLTESGKISIDSMCLRGYNKIHEIEFANPKKIMVSRGKTNPYFYEDGSLTSFKKESIEKGFQGKTIYKKQLCGVA